MNKELNNEKRPNLFKRLGWGAFIFFLLKGIVYLIFGATLLEFIGC
jgi:hypothetical protein